MFKKIYHLVIGVFLLIHSDLNAQNNYLKGHVMVYFRDGTFDKDVLRQNLKLYKRDELMVNVPALRDSLQKMGVQYLRKVIRNAHPDKKFSTSRTGDEIPVSMFYNLMRLEVPENTDIPKLCSKLEKLPEVIFAEPDYLMKITATAPDDTKFGSQRGLENYNDIDIDILRAWDFAKGSSTVRVGVLDTGIDYHNPDLGNGSFGPGNKVAGGFDYILPDFDPDDGHFNSHGTAVAGIIGAYSNNGEGVAGIAGGDAVTGNPGVELIALRIVATDGDIPASSVVESIYDGATSVNQGGFGCHILNASFGGYNVSNSIRKAISFAASNGVIFVASKGNDNSTNQHYPSDYSDNLVLSVGASDENDEKWSDSNYSNGIDVVAPGTEDLLYTTIRLESSPFGSSYGRFGGTSGATPVVSGVAALLKSVNINLHRDDIERIIEISAQDVRPDKYTYVNGYHEQMGHGRVNAGRALELLHAPYVLQHHTATGGTSENITYGDIERFSFLNDGGNSGLAEGLYFGQIYQVTKTINIPLSGCNEKYVWPRTVGATVGWQEATINSNLGHSIIVSQTATTVTLRTFVYYIEINSIGQEINAWYPAAPQNVVFAYTTLTNMPYSTDVTGPSSVCTSGSTLALTTVPPNSTITWQATPAHLFTVSSGTGSSAVLTAANSTIRNQGTITFTVASLCGGAPIPISRTFWIGKPLLSATSSNGGQVNFTNPGNPVNYNSVPNLIEKKVDMVTSGGGGSWQRLSANPTNMDWSASNNRLSFYFFQVGQTATFRYTASNTCGSTVQDYSFKSTGSSGGGCSQFTVSPNPSSTELNIIVPNIPAPCPGSTTQTSFQSESTENQLSINNVNLYDSNGKLVLTEQFESTVKNTKIDITHLRKGVYILKVSDGAYIETHRIVVKE